MSNEVRKLYRLEEGKILGGVCAGLGEYFNVDPVLVRLLWVLIVFMGGSGILIYIILWIVLPAKTGEKVHDLDAKKKVMDDSEYRANYGFAFFLIFLGLIFLFNTTGIVSWNIWNVIWKFWPVFIIFAGLNLIADSNKVLKTIVGVLSVIALILVFLWSWAIASAEKLSDDWDKRLPSWIERIDNNEMLNSQEYISLEDYPDVTKSNIAIEMSVGSLDIVNNADDDYLTLLSTYEGRFQEPSLETNLDNDNENLNIDVKLGETRDFVFFNIGDAPKYTMKLGQNDVHENLSLNLGAGKTSINLNNYNLRKLNLVLGAGKIDVNLAKLELENLNLDIGAGKMDIQIQDDVNFKDVINVKIGAGQLAFRIPDEYGYEINGTLGVGSMDVRDKSISGLGRDLDKVRSENYDTAETVLKFNVDVGVGNFVINSI